MHVQLHATAVHNIIIRITEFDHTAFPVYSPSILVMYRYMTVAIQGHEGEAAVFRKALPNPIQTPSKKLVWGSVYRVLCDGECTFICLASKLQL